MTCPVCEGKGAQLYEDEHIMILHEKQASKGHLRIAPKQHVTNIEDIPDQLMEHLFFAANYASAVLFELTGAHGTNILMAEGTEHIHLDIVERKQDDGMNFLWKPKKLTNEEMDAAAKRIKDVLIVGKAEKPAPVIVKADEPKEIKIEEGKPNLLLRQLDRIP